MLSGTAPTPRPWGGWGRSFHPSKAPPTPGARAELSYKKELGDRSLNEGLSAMRFHSKSSPLWHLFNQTLAAQTHF